MEALYLHISSKLEAIRFGKKASPKNPLFTLLNVSELTTWQLWRAVFAELLAQTLFVFLGCCSALEVAGSADANANRLKIALCFGLAIMALVQMVGHVSGGHINPAVSIAMAVAMKISIVRCVLYVLAQVGGAIAGAFIVKAVTPAKFHHNLAVTSVSPSITVWEAVGIEAILTFTLVAVIFATTDGNRTTQGGSPAVHIGLTVALGHLSAIQYTGASMNPSRSLGSAVASHNFQDHWVYWLGPVSGGVLAALVYFLVLDPYRGVTSVDEAVEELRESPDTICIPRSYFCDDIIQDKKNFCDDVESQCPSSECSPRPQQKQQQQPSQRYQSESSSDSE